MVEGTGAIAIEGRGDGAVAGMAVGGHVGIGKGTCESGVGAVVGCVEGCSGVTNSMR